MKNDTIKYKNDRIILSHERKQKATIHIYPSQHLLTYVREGILKIKNGENFIEVGAGEFVLIKKHTATVITKTWNKEDTKFSSFVFSFQEDLVQGALILLNPLPLPYNHKTNSPSVISISSNPILKQFIHSLHLFFEEHVEMDQNMARLKTTEALLGILKSDTSLQGQLLHFSVKSKVDLYTFMKHSFLQNLKLEEFAKQSGRSLSTFKKDFQNVFQKPPALWLKQQRLEHAYKLLSTTVKKASEVYLECGFEDLAHFSKSFKEYFKINPSELNKPLRQEDPTFETNP